MIDVNCFIGAFPFRELPHPDADVLVRVLEREGIVFNGGGRVSLTRYRWKPRGR